MIELTFKVGQRVQWFSASRGNGTRKEGKVVMVIPLGRTLAMDVIRELGRTFNTDPINKDANSRDHRSYLVAVDRPDGTHQRPKIYWPRVSQLEVL